MCTHGHVFVVSGTEVRKFAKIFPKSFKQFFMYYTFDTILIECSLIWYYRFQKLNIIIFIRIRYCILWNSNQLCSTSMPIQICFKDFNFMKFEPYAYDIDCLVDELMMP